MNTPALLATVSARQLQRDYKSVFTQAQKSQEPIMIISNNTPQVVMLSIESFKTYADSLNRQLLWETITSIQSKNLDKTPEEVEKDVNAAVKRARMKIYEETFGSARQQRHSKRNSLPLK